MPDILLFYIYLFYRHHNLLMLCLLTITITLRSKYYFLVFFVDHETEAQES